MIHRLLRLLSQGCRQKIGLIGLVGLLCLVGIGNRIWVIHQAGQSPATAIVVLGGGIQREIFAAQLAQDHPQLPILISSGSATPCVYQVFVRDQHIDWQRITIDWRATNTVTNFTATLPYLQDHDHHHVL